MDQEEYDRLKEVYKDHYRKIGELKKKLSDVRRMDRVNRALEQMNPDNLMENFDLALLKLREKMAIAEARISTALHGIDEENPVSSDTGTEPVENEEELRKSKARQTLEELKNQMGVLQQEVEEKARSISNKNQSKTIGRTERTTEVKAEEPKSGAVRKTIGTHPVPKSNQDRD
ncbi:MAG TPA: hypothetical protein VKA08_15190 [Balneolales bacterium]|nr:hypothetical protein [Balneolales bacterium]